MGACLPELHLLLKVLLIRSSTPNTISLLVNNYQDIKAEVIRSKGKMWQIE